MRVAYHIVRSATEESTCEARSTSTTHRYNVHLTFLGQRENLISRISTVADHKRTLELHNGEEDGGMRETWQSEGERGDEKRRAEETSAD